MFNFITITITITITAIRVFFEDLQDWWADRDSRIKVAKIHRVLQREVLLIGGSLSHVTKRVCGHPGRCVLGVLLAAAGVADANLSEKGIPTTEWLRVLSTEYGITQNEAFSLLDANDNESGVIWKACGLKRDHSNIDKVRVCVVNERLGELTARAF